jgi:hypothetical protein
MFRISNRTIKKVVNDLGREDSSHKRIATTLLEESPCEIFRSLQQPQAAGGLNSLPCKEFLPFHVV